MQIWFGGERAVTPKEIGTKEIIIYSIEFLSLIEKKFINISVGYQIKIFIQKDDEPKV